MPTRHSMPVHKPRQVIPASIYDGCHLPKQFVKAVAKELYNRFRIALLQQLQAEEQPLQTPRNNKKPKCASNKARHIHYHLPENAQLRVSGNLNIQKVDSLNVNNDQKSSQQVVQPQQETDRNRRAVLAVHQQCSCNAAEWAVVVKLLEEQGAIDKAAYQYAATYINEICGEEVTSAKSLARSIIYTKVIGKYPDWRIKDDEKSRETPNKLRRFKDIARIFTYSLNN